jgi:Na+/phosphate symporter
MSEPTDKELAAKARAFIRNPDLPVSLSPFLSFVAKRLNRLETERNRLADSAIQYLERIKELLDERDAIATATIERCAQTIEAKHCDLTSTTAAQIIRALKPTD